MSHLPILNISAYKFVDLENLSDLQKRYKSLCHELNLKGTLIFSLEGINCYIAGYKNNIRTLQTALSKEEVFADLVYKESFSEITPFQRMFVKIKKTLTSCGLDYIKPHKNPAPCVSAQELKNWIDQKKEMVILDIRNTYEYQEGSFQDAMPCNIQHFREFSAFVDQQLPGALKEKIIVTVCTGGIRCEKAAPYLIEQGFNKTYQLEGGILQYFIHCGSTHFEGKCYVFDERVMISAESMISESC